MKAFKTIETSKDIKDLMGWTIPEGATLHIMRDPKELPVNPADGTILLIVRVDNGTGQLDLMPETAVLNTEIDDGS